MADDACGETTMNDKMTDDNRNNIPLPEDDLSDEDIYYYDDRDRKNIRRIRQVEFRKGILCGLLIGGICILAFLLFSFGT